MQKMLVFVRPIGHCSEISIYCWLVTQAVGYMVQDANVGNGAMQLQNLVFSPLADHFFQRIFRNDKQTGV